MQLSLLLLSLLLSAFPTQLPVADGQSFDFPSGKLDSSSLSPLQHGVVDSTGTLTLDSSTGDAVAFYSNPITLSGTISPAVLSFTSFFTFSSTATSGNGTIAFVLVPDVSTASTDWVTTARKTFSVEFNTSCSAGLGFPNESFYGDHAFFGGGGWGGYGRGGGWRGSGPFGGMGGFQVIEYANNTVVPDQNVSGYGPNYDGPLQDDGNLFCSQEPPQTASAPIFQYEVVVEYNASTKTLWVGSPSCGVAIARTTQFASQDLSSIITTPVHPGFLVYGGAVFNITQWNFTNNVNTSSVTSLALSTSVAPVTPSSSSDGSPDAVVGDGGRRRGGSGLKKGYVIAFSILGAAIGVAAVLLACCLCARRRRRAAAAATEGKYVVKRGYAGTIPQSAVVFDAQKPTAPPAKVALVERDTMPLNSHPNSTSTGAASWLKPVQPR